MQKYGMLLADAGKVPLTAQSDRFTQHKWKDVGVDARSLDKIRVTDMEVVDMENATKWDGDCHRN
jgi:serine/threonine-protein kinase